MNFRQKMFMNMIRLDTKHLAKALASLILISVFYCVNSLSTELFIGEVSQPIYSGSEREKENDPLTYSSCKEWRLTPAQVKDIFKISNKYVDNTIAVNHYYWLPCDIKGWLVNNGVKITFSINAASIAEWYNTNNKEHVYWGCSKKKCEDYFLLTYNAMGDGAN